MTRVVEHSEGESASQGKGYAYFKTNEHGDVWYCDKKGDIHRTDGPAVEWADGDREWYLHGKRHREDGSAVVWSKKRKEWWLDGESYNEKDFHFEIERRKKQGSTAPLARGYFCAKPDEAGNVLYCNEKGLLHMGALMSA